jgi:antitoxin CptB
MLELDELLGRFLENHYSTASAAEQALFKELLTHNDQDLFTWLMGHKPPTDARFIALIHRIRTNA